MNDGWPTGVRELLAARIMDNWEHAPWDDAVVATFVEKMGYALDEYDNTRLAAADRLAEAVPEGEESADGHGVRLTWAEYQALIRAAADYRRIREGREG